MARSRRRGSLARKATDAPVAILLARGPHQDSVHGNEDPRSTNRLTWKGEHALDERHAARQIAFVGEHGGERRRRQRDDEVGDAEMRGGTSLYRVQSARWRTRSRPTKGWLRTDRPWRRSSLRPAIVISVPMRRSRVDSPAAQPGLMSAERIGPGLVAHGKTIVDMPPMLGRDFGRIDRERLDRINDLQDFLDLRPASYRAEECLRLAERPTRRRRARPARLHEGCRSATGSCRNRWPPSARRQRCCWAQSSRHGGVSSMICSFATWPKRIQVSMRFSIHRSSTCVSPPADRACCCQGDIVRSLWSDYGSGVRHADWAGFTAAPRFAGQDGPDAGIGGRGLGADIGPRLQVVERVDDAAADFPVLRSCSVGAMLLERAAGKTEETGGLGRAQKSWRQTGSGSRAWLCLHRIADRPPDIGGAWRRQWRSFAGRGDGEVRRYDFRHP